jgi:Skp family chaperone for outer membrane proteins
LKKRLITPVLLSALFGIAAGCNKEDSSASSASKAAPINPIATVNLDSVFKAMGWVDEINKIMKASNDELNAEIEPKMKQFKDAFEDKKKEIAKAANITPEALGGAKTNNDLVNLHLTPKQIDDLLQANAILQQNAQQINNAHQQFLQQRQAAVLGAYREAVQPVVKRVATANNRSMAIAIPNPGIVYSDASLDLTEKVIDDLQKSPTFKIAVPEMQHIHWNDAPPASTPATQP